MAIDPKNEVNKSEKIILGSGDLYMMEFDGDIPEDTVIEAEENQAGNIKGGASAEFSTSTQTVSDDKGRVSVTVTTEETVKFKTGLITWSQNWMEAVMRTARVVANPKPGHRTIKIGGIDNESKKKWLYRFVHTKQNGKKVRLTATGKNVGAVNLNFTNDNPTQLDAEINAEPLDGEGTKIIYDEEIDVQEGE